MVATTGESVHGDYAALDSGWAGTAVEDLTGGVTTVIRGDMLLYKERLWCELLAVGEGNFLFSLSTGSQGDSYRNGLALRHNYTVLEAIQVKDEFGDIVSLVKIRNPWGQRCLSGYGDWGGVWSDGSESWTPFMMEKLQYKFGDDAGHSQDLELAIACARRLVDITAKDGPEWAEQAANLGTVLIYRYERNRTINDLEEATTVARQAVAATPDDHGDYSSWVSNLGIIYNHRFEFTGSIWDLEHAIGLFRQAIMASSREQPDFAVWANNLAYLLCVLYEKTSSPRDIDEAIHFAQEAVLATSERDPGYPARIYNLGLAFDLRFQQTGSTQDLLQAILSLRQAVSAAEPTDTCWLGKLDNLMDQLDSSFPIQFS
ncbi:hypothetical protein FOQG_15143 [Fusarium oxysporum f. sp. raphani 54005]|uniref:Calpain catalytic domain-containing protein n=2 Tax=Fusarium oxysporum TaxID=5507 RepID=X0BEX0_FUSOX|nr:hypothetical protein FOQG_15143 [Fusarium oxysporum f. sp. raphani 54005]